MGQNLQAQWLDNGILRCDFVHVDGEAPDRAILSPTFQGFFPREVSLRTAFTGIPQPWRIPIILRDYGKSVEMSGGSQHE